MRVKPSTLVVVLTLLCASLLQGASQALLPVTLRTDYGGRFQSTVSYEYDSRGNLVTVRELYGNEDWFGMLITTSYTYGKHGELVTSVEELDAPVDGWIDERSTSTYFELPGNQTQELRQSHFGVDGFPEIVENIVTTFDKKGRPVLQVLENYYQGYILQYRETSSWVYDDQNHRIIWEDELDHFGYGFSDRLYRGVTTVDRHGNPVTSTYKFDDNADGIIDDGITRYFAFDYAPNGIVLGWTVENFHPTEIGLPSSTQTYRYTYEHRKVVLGAKSNQPGKSNKYPGVSRPGFQSRSLSW